MNNTKRYFNREDISPLDLALIWGSMRLEQLLPSCDHMDPENEAKIWQTWATSWNQILSSNIWASKSSHAWIYPFFFLTLSYLRQHSLFLFTNSSLHLLNKGLKKGQYKPKRGRCLTSFKISISNTWLFIFVLKKWNRLNTINLPCTQF